MPPHGFYWLRVPRSFPDRQTPKNRIWSSWPQCKGFPDKGLHHYYTGENLQPCQAAPVRACSSAGGRHAWSGPRRILQGAQERRRDLLRGTRAGRPGARKQRAWRKRALLNIMPNYGWLAGHTDANTPAWNP